MTSRDAIKGTVKDYILTEFLPGTAPSELGDQTPLIQGAILDSLATVQLVAFLEERFGGGWRTLLPGRSVPPG